MSVKKNCCVWISWVAIAVSLVSLGLVLIRVKPIAYDWAGVMVGSLSALVVMLIGWNIYSLVDFKESVKEVKKLSTKIGELEIGLNAQMSRMHLLTNMGITDIYYRFITGDVRNRDFKYLYHNVVSIMYACEVKDIITCNAIIKTMLDVVISPESIKLSKHEKDIVLKFISNIKHANEIEQYVELVQCLSKIGVLHD